MDFLENFEGLHKMGWQFSIQIFPLVICWTIFVYLQSPLRRMENIRLLLSLMEQGFYNLPKKEWQAVWQQKSRRTDRRILQTLHQLSSQVSHGLTIPEAMEQNPGDFPTRFIALFRCAHEAGRLPLAIPICRKILNNSMTHVVACTNFLMPFLGLFTLFLILTFMGKIIFPKLGMILSELTVSNPDPLILKLADSWIPTLAPLCFAGGILFFLLTFQSWSLPNHLQSLMKYFPWRAPWLKIQTRRDFSSLLALCLDAEIPEARAVQLASLGTNDKKTIEHGNTVIARLGHGIPLVDALGEFDDRGELQWRFRNAASSRGKFAEALQGWHDALDARAFHLEQAWAQVLSVFVTLMTGTLVGVICFAIFDVLISIIQEACLW